MTRLQKAECELYYVVKFPIDQKYISLYPNSDANAAETTKERQEFLDELMANIKSGDLPSGLHKSKPESKAYFEVERIRKSGEVFKQNDEEQSANGHNTQAPESENKQEKEGEGDEFFA